MPYSEQIDERLGRIVIGTGNIVRKKMFGGVCYLLNGNMFCGVYKDFLFLRLGEQGAAEALRSDHVRPFDITGRPMKGWVMVEESGFRQDEELEGWLEEARDFVSPLPAK